MRAREALVRRAGFRMGEVMECRAWLSQARKVG